MTAREAKKEIRRILDLIREGELTIVNGHPHGQVAVIACVVVRDLETVWGEIRALGDKNALCSTYTQARAWWYEAEARAKQLCRLVANAEEGK